MSTLIAHPTRQGSLVGLISASRDTLERVPTSVLAIVLRIAIAVVFFRSGLTKIASWDATIALFDMEYMLPLLPPELGASLATAAELGCPILLVLGLATRFAALVLLGMTLVIQIFVYPENWPDHLLWASILGYLAARGAGAISADHLIGRHLYGANRG